LTWISGAAGAACYVFSQADGQDNLVAETGFLTRHRFSDLLAVLADAGYRVAGPVHLDGAIVYTDLHSAADLPAGVMVETAPGTVRTSATQLPRLFAWANGPQALKPLLFGPEETLWRVRRADDGALTFSAASAEVQPHAVIGVRACDLAALCLQDQHFLHGAYRDQHYAARRAQLLLVAVNCTHPAATCFCAATGDGPQAQDGFDLLLDELDEGFIVSSGSERGRELFADLPLLPARADQMRKVASASHKARAMQTRAIPAGDLYDPLMARREHPRWSEVAERCLSCGNCTQVCPTCFCSRELDQAQLDGLASTHVRQWDSCFSEGHSYIHGLVVRGEPRYRYRQWLTHKLGGWHRQYGRSGCVGCGRCIAWCPVGIDICAEVNALLGGDHDS
jgi:sulfhydrogenase subunit beta (sulfur reductase)